MVFRFVTFNSHVNATPMLKLFWLDTIQQRKNKLLFNITFRNNPSTRIHFLHKQLALD
jgi:hypothetical protein